MSEAKEFFLHLSAVEFQRALGIYLDHNAEEAVLFLKEKIVEPLLAHSCKRASGLKLPDVTCRLRKCRNICCRTSCHHVKD